MPDRPQPQQSGSDRFITMHRCGKSGSIFVCHCAPRLTDLDAGPDYSCEDETEVRYVRFDLSVPIVHHAVMQAEVDRLRATLTAIAVVLDRGIPDDRKLTVITRLVHETAPATTGKGPSDAA